MKNRLAILSVLAILALSALACAAGAPQQEGPSGNKMATSLAAVQKALTTETPASISPADDPVKDISMAKLKLSDFPAGYKELTVSDMQDMDLSPESLSGSFTKNLQKAKVVNTAGFMNSDPQNFELHISLVIYPLTFLEKTSFDLEMLDPEKIGKQVSSEMGTEMALMNEASGIGDKSIGLSFKTAPKADAKVQFRGQMVMVRQNNAVAMVIGMFLDGKEPGVSTVELTKKLNERLAGVVK